MSSDTSVAAVRGGEAATRGDSPPHSPDLPSPLDGESRGGGRDLVELAAAIDRVEALITEAAQEPDGSAALERLQDIAFVLHEREVEASLADALDAAVREIADACARQQAAVQRTHQAVDLLRALSRRINAMIALASTEAGPVAAIADGAAGEEAANHDMPPRLGPSEAAAEAAEAANAPEDADFVQPVAALAASLPSPADPGEPTSNEKSSSDPSSSEAPPSTEIPNGWGPRETSLGEDLANENALALPQPGAIMPAPTVALSHPAPDAPAGGNAAPALQVVPPAAPAAPGDFAVEQAVHRDTLSDGENQLPGHADQQGAVDSLDRPSADAEEADLLLEREPSRALLPESQPAVDPEEDPGDLFEPMAKPPLAAPFEAVALVVAPAAPSDLASSPEHAGSASSESAPEYGEDAEAAMHAPEAERSGEVSAADTAALARTASAAPDANPPPQAPSPQPHVAAAVATPGVPRTAPSDPLAPLRALSEEEMIALFS